MQYRRVKQMVFWSMLVVMLMSACTRAETEGEAVSVANVQVFVFPGETEKRLISEEKIVQDNCDGAAETSQTVTRQQTVQYTMEVGAGLTVSAEGNVGIPSMGEVAVGAEVATHYKVGYGRTETVSRSVTVATTAGSHIQHTIQQFELWEKGEVLIVGGEQSQRLPYSLRRDFSIEAVAPANIGCDLTSTLSVSENESTSLATPSSVPQIESPLVSEGNSNLQDCNGNPSQNFWYGTDSAISHNFGFPVNDRAWGATKDPNQPAMDVALAYGPYINLAPGQYKVVYRISIDGNESPNTPVVRLNIAAYVNGIDNPNLANRLVSFGEVNAQNEFADYELRFVLRECATNVEFRAYYQNAGNVSLESITLVQE